jgi:hypothetical protein
LFLLRFLLLFLFLLLLSFWKNQPLSAQLHMAYDIPTRFHKVWSRHLWEIERTKMCGQIFSKWQVVKSPKQRLETYCFCSVSYYYFYFYYYYYITLTVIGWCIAILGFIFTIIYYYSSTHFCPLDFSEMPWSNFMKPCRNIICHVKFCSWGLIFSKWLPLPWKRTKC